MEFNKQHPELKEGEMFILNEEENSTAQITFASMPYETKRYGKTAYDDTGKKLEKTKPIFIKIEEFNSHFNKELPQTQKAFLIGTHSNSFRPGEPAKIIGVVFVTPDGFPARVCYEVLYKDGRKDFVALSDSLNFQIVSEDEVEN
jgi:hypothetical protein